MIFFLKRANLKTLCADLKKNVRFLKGQLVTFLEKSFLERKLSYFFTNDTFPLGFSSPSIFF